LNFINFPLYFIKLRGFFEVRNPPSAMEFFLSVPPFVGGIQSALDQPIFPGKIIAWLLLMLSILSWVLILSKASHLVRVRRADRRFAKRLRQSRTTLEVFEEGWRDEQSLQFLVYSAGARETAFQLLGTRNPGEDLQRRLRDAGKLEPPQTRFLRGAFRAGYRQAVARLGTGLDGLRFIVVAATLFGLLGGAWTLMEGFDSGGGTAAVGSALGFLVIALLVVIPALLARLAFALQVRKIGYALRKFRDDIARLFARKFSRGEPGATSRRTKSSLENRLPVETTEERGGGTEAEEFASPGRESGSAERPDYSGDGEDGEDGGKRYHSIRERLLRPPSTDPEEDEFSVNPIARQAAVLRVR